MKKPCITCPFNFSSEEAEQVQNYGCLPTPTDIINLKKKHNANWACHYSDSSNLKTCGGLIQVNKEAGLGFEITEDQPKIDYSRWYTEGDYLSKD